MSRWSESTRSSEPQPSLASVRSPEVHHLAREGSARSHITGQMATLYIDEVPAIAAKSIATEAFLRGRGSDDSQASYGPPTPTDELAVPPVQIALEEPENDMYNTPRRAPLPPGSGMSPVLMANLPGKVPSNRRGSVTQSMMRTLTGKKREGIIPPPLDVSVAMSKTSSITVD